MALPQARRVSSRRAGERSRRFFLCFSCSRAYSAWSPLVEIGEAVEQAVVKSVSFDVSKERLIVDEGGQGRDDDLCGLWRWSCKCHGITRGHIEGQLQRGVGRGACTCEGA